MERELEKAMWVQRQNRDLQPVLFAMLSGKDHAPMVWRMLEPKREDERRTGGEKATP